MWVGPPPGNVFRSIYSTANKSIELIAMHWEIYAGTKGDARYIYIYICIYHWPSSLELYWEYRVNLGVTLIHCTENREKEGKKSNSFDLWYYLLVTWILTGSLRETIITSPPFNGCTKFTVDIYCMFTNWSHITRSEKDKNGHLIPFYWNGRQ